MRDTVCLGSPELGPSSIFVIVGEVLSSPSLKRRDGWELWLNRRSLGKNVLSTSLLLTNSSKLRAHTSLEEMLSLAVINIAFHQCKGGERYIVMLDYHG